MPGKRLSVGLKVALTIFALTLVVTSTRAVAQQEKVLHRFCLAKCPDGYQPEAGLIFDAAGNLYGTVTRGGTPGGGGTAFELTPKAGGVWTERVLHHFGEGYDGFFPSAGLIFDAAGNLYGTTQYGGNHSGGTVFELTPKAGGGWAEKVLYAFNDNGTDGYNPQAGLALDTSGNLYGTTFYGGAHSVGTVFELMPKTGGDWTEKILHSFNNNGKDGSNPTAGLIFDGSFVNLYGTTSQGGNNIDGTVFELTPKAGGGWTEKILHSFPRKTGNDGVIPYAGLIFDGAGNLYGTTWEGGRFNGGTVFELTPIAGGRWTEKILHNFGNGMDGAELDAGLVFDLAGNLYGTTVSGGTLAWIIHEVSSQKRKDALKGMMNTGFLHPAFPFGASIA